jgi:flagellar biosynthesis protein FlhF
LRYSDVIFTALDEVTQHGTIYNFVRQTNQPLFGFGIGPKVPDDFERATPERVVDLIMDLTKNFQQQDNKI